MTLMPTSEYDDFFTAEDLKPAVDDTPLAGQAPPAPPRLGILTTLTSEQFDQVARSAKLHFVEADTTIVAQGELGDRFYVVMEGEVEIVRDGAAVARLSPGAFFGETALISGERRSADVRTRCPSVLWSIGRDAFESALGRSLLNDPAAAAEIQRRMSGNGSPPPGAI